MVTELERAIWDSAVPIRATRFAQILRNARVSSGDSALPGPDSTAQGWELSFDPAIQRTIGADTALRMQRHTSTVGDDQWLKWNLEAKRAMSRIAAKCWVGIDSRRRAVFVDEDNFHPIWGKSNLWNLRLETLGRHLDFEGLSEPGVTTALEAIYRAAHATPAYERALDADRQLARSPAKLNLWAQIAKKGNDDLDAALKGLVIGDGLKRGLEIVAMLYADTPVADIAASFRGYNHLVQQIVWSILGLAEMEPGPFSLTDVVGAIRCTHGRDGGPVVRVTCLGEGLVLLRLTNPIWLKTATPLDGLYTLAGYSVTLAPGAASDLSLSSIRWSAGCWP
jgi:hypothetical protein